VFGSSLVAGAQRQRLSPLELGPRIVPRRLLMKFAQ
jgi:hypothetical protein